jgi:hypothetical protein
VDAGAAEVGIDEEGFLLLQAVGDGEVHGGGGLAFARGGGGEEQAAGTVSEVGEEDGIAQGADGFLEGGDLLGAVGGLHQLGRSPGSIAVGMAAAIPGDGEETAAPLFDDGERAEDVGFEALLDLVGVADGVVEGVGQDGDADGEEGGEEQGQYGVEADVREHRV